MAHDEHLAAQGTRDTRKVKHFVLGPFDLAHFNSKSAVPNFGLLQKILVYIFQAPWIVFDIARLIYQTTKMNLNCTPFWTIFKL